MPRFTKGEGDDQQVVETSNAVEGARLRASGFTQEAEAAGDYESLKVTELKAEIERRNEGRDAGDQISATGNKADLVDALAADDE